MVDQEQEFPSSAGAAPSIEDKPDLRPPDFKLFDPEAVGIAAFLGSGAAAGIVAAVNELRLGNQKRALAAVAAGLLLTVGLIILGQLIPWGGAATGISIGFAIGAREFARKHYDKAYADHMRAGGAYASRWGAAGIGLAFMAVLFAGLFWYHSQSDLGPSVEAIPGNRVHYQNGATEAEAQVLAHALVDMGWGGHGQEIDVWIEGEGAERAVGMVIGDLEPSLLGSFKFIGETLRTYVGPERPLTLILVNGEVQEVWRYQTKGVLGRLHPTKDQSRVFFTGEQAELAANVDKAMRSVGLFAGQELNLLLSDAVDSDVCIVVDKQPVEPLQDLFTNIGNTLKPVLTTGPSVRVGACDGDGKQWWAQDIPPPPAAAQ